MVGVIRQLPRIEETDKIDLEALDKLRTATIKATIESRRVSPALASIGQSAARKCEFLSHSMRCHVKFMFIWSGVLPSEPIGTGRPVSAVPSSPKQAPV